LSVFLGTIIEVSQAGFFNKMAIVNSLKIIRVLLGVGCGGFEKKVFNMHSAVPENLNAKSINSSLRQRQR
tara:strand:+ start:61 stop:270 length:210 start_codon:yes stop_codon:yes gene_type:complete